MPIGPLGKLNENIYKIDKDIFLKAKEKFEKKEKENLIIEFKPAEERACNYMLINSNGEAYKVDLANKKVIYGNICEVDTWENIWENLC